ncbi:MAG: bifunctional riboflavin kinase/FAD synthetase [Clostridia bacterium]|nr:bifunctional riboflavin kinase/FAD synthetase [Clostridia bacterium]
MIGKGSAIALGFFDGVHIAHQKIIESAVRYAELNNLIPIALSFDKSPLEILSGNHMCYLTSNAEKEAIITSLGAKAEFLPTDKALLSVEPEVFIEKILVGKYNIKYAVCGYNYRFGKNGRGDTDLLMKEGKRHGFEVLVAPCQMYNGESISSSRIRGLLAEGEISLANNLLGRNFFIEGTVSEGKKLGRKIGFPTANVFFDDKAAQLKNGVYKTLVTVDAKCYDAITNAGTNPTVCDKSVRTETYIPDFEGNLYGKKIKIEFIKFIRPEIKFENLEKLTEQIREDLKNL